mgnify:CR=1 FL=1
MTTSRMLSKDLEALEGKYQHKCDSIRKIMEIRPTENGMQIWEHCNRALSQLKRLRAVFERTF